jgi:hypothetical protein
VCAKSQKSPISLSSKLNIYNFNNYNLWIWGFVDMGISPVFKNVFLKKEKIYFQKCKKLALVISPFLHIPKIPKIPHFKYI